MRKHGSCSALTQEAYIAAIGRPWDSFRVPAAFRDGTLTRTDRSTLMAKISGANPGVPREAVALRGRGRDFAQARLPLPEPAAVCLRQRRAWQLPSRRAAGAPGR